MSTPTCDPSGAIVIRPSVTVTIVPHRRPAVIAAADDAYSGPRHLGIPVTWIDAGKVRCPNGHVSLSVQEIKSKEGHASETRCRKCGSPVWLTFPEDR